MALLGELEDDRRQAGWSVEQAAWPLGISVREYRELEVGVESPNFETWDRICKLFGWPQTSRPRAPLARMPSSVPAASSMGSP